jgi:hypothetical protein
LLLVNREGRHWEQVYRVTNQRTGAVFADKIISKEIFKRRRTAKEKVQDSFLDPDLVGSGSV